MGSSTAGVGALRHRLVIEAEGPAGDGGGGQGADPWANAIRVATVWGQIVPLTGPRTGAETSRAARLEARVTHRITLRWRPGILARHRIRFGDRVFNIRSVTNRDERNRVLEILAEEGVAT